LQYDIVKDKYDPDSSILAYLNYYISFINADMEDDDHNDPPKKKNNSEKQQVEKEEQQKKIDDDDDNKHAAMSCDLVDEDDYY
jgi:hypothetical protein